MAWEDFFWNFKAGKLAGARCKRGPANQFRVGNGNGLEVGTNE